MKKVPTTQKKSITIPKEFSLHGIRYTVKFQADLGSVHGLAGEARYASSEVVLQKPSESYPIRRDILEETYLHEIVHHILQAMSNTLCGDEVFVETFAALLHQVFVTQEGEL